MTIQALVGLGKNVKVVGTRSVAASFTNDLTFTYPTDNQSGDLLIAHVVCENKIVPTISNGWSTIFSNTTTNVNGTGSGRLLAYKRSGNETSANVFVSGGGTCNMISLRGYLGTIENVTEFVANNELGNTDFTQSISSQQALVVFANQDGGGNNAIITIANTSTYINTEPGYFRSMAIGYSLGVGTDPISVNTSSDSVYGVYLTVF